MNGQIMALANHLVYNNRLRSGSANVDSRTLQLPLLSAVLETHSLEPWMMRVLDQKHGVVFINTDEVFSLHSQ